MSKIVRNMEDRDCEVLAAGFKEQGWNKPAELYKEYLSEVEQGLRDAFVVEENGELLGYVTIAWTSDFKKFVDIDVPEIKDLNVFMKHRRKGAATLLMDEAESRIGKKSAIAGLGVGLYNGYGNAQKMYVKRGYIPTGDGINYDGEELNYGAQVTLDDDLCLLMTKELSQ